MNNHFPNDFEFEQRLRSSDPARAHDLHRATEAMRDTWKSMLERKRRQKQIAYGLSLATTFLLGLVGTWVALSGDVNRERVAEVSPRSDHQIPPPFDARGTSDATETPVDPVRPLESEPLKEQGIPLRASKMNKQHPRNTYQAKAIDWATTLAMWDRLSGPVKVDVLRYLRVDPQRIASLLEVAGELSDPVAKRTAVNLAVELHGRTSETLLLRLFQQPELSVAAWEVAVAHANEKGLVKLAQLADQETSRRLIAKRCAELGSDEATSLLLSFCHRKPWLPSVRFASQFLGNPQRKRLTLAITAGSEKERVAIGFVLASIHDPQFDARLHEMAVRGWYRQEALQVLMFRHSTESVNAIRRFQQDPQFSASVFAAMRGCRQQLELVRQLSRMLPNENSLLHHPPGELDNEDAPSFAA